MPLSDAARRLLGQLRPGAQPPEPEPVPDPVEVPAPEPAPEPEAPKGRGGFKERARREEERFRLATDSEYWVAFCFRRPGDPAAFAAALGLAPDGRYITGSELDHATRTIRADGSPAARRKQILAARSTRGQDLTGQLGAKPPPDPLGTLPQPGDDLQAESAAELTAILAALQAPPDPASVLDSPHWLAAYWPNRDAKDAWLAATGLDVLGDKYVDGHQAARILGIHLKEG